MTEIMQKKLTDEDNYYSERRNEDIDIDEEIWYHIIQS